MNGILVFSSVCIHRNLRERPFPLQTFRTRLNFSFLTHIDISSEGLPCCAACHCFIVPIPPIATKLLFYFYFPANPSMIDSRWAILISLVYACHFTCKQKMNILNNKDRQIVLATNKYIFSVKFTAFYNFFYIKLQIFQF